MIVAIDLLALRPPRRCGSSSRPPRRGYWPEALSADSMMASAPSNTAVATSDTSARVGTGATIIDSSICVATTTGLPWRRASRVMRFCRPGTCSSGISTPRSPRATISASETAMISSRRAIACGFSILAMTSARPLAIFRTSMTSSGRCTKESAIQSMSSSSAASRSARSFVRHRRGRDGRVGQADALLVGDAPGDLDDRDGAPLLDAVDPQQHLAVVDQEPMTRLERREDFGMRQIDARLRARRRVRIEREVVALAQQRPRPPRTRRRAASGPAGRPECRSAGRIAPRASGSSPRARAWRHARRGSC